MVIDEKGAVKIQPQQLLLRPIFLIETPMDVKDDLRWFWYLPRSCYQQFHVPVYCWIYKKHPL